MENTDNKCEILTFDSWAWTPCGMPAVKKENGKWVCRFHTKHAEEKRQKQYQEKQLLEEFLNEYNTVQKLGTYIYNLQKGK